MNKTKWVVAILCAISILAGCLYYLGTQIRCHVQVCPQAYTKVTSNFSGKVSELCKRDDLKKLITDHSICTDAFGTYSSYPVDWNTYYFNSFSIDYISTGDPGGFDNYPKYSIGYINEDPKLVVVTPPTQWKKDGNKYSWQEKIYSQSDKRNYIFEFYITPPDFSIQHKADYDEFLKKEHNAPYINTYDHFNKSDAIIIADKNIIPNASVSSNVAEIENIINKDKEIQGGYAHIPNKPLLVKIVNQTLKVETIFENSLGSDLNYVQLRENNCLECDVFVSSIRDNSNFFNSVQKKKLKEGDIITLSAILELSPERLPRNDQEFNTYNIKEVKDFTL